MTGRDEQRPLPFSGEQTAGPAPRDAEGAEGPSGSRGAEQSLPSAVDLEGRTVYAVDAHSLIFQVFHAIPEMTSGRGEPVAAVYGFTRDMLSLLEQKRPDFLLCAFDMPGPTFRHEIFDQYKADRAGMPEELVSQIPKIRSVLEALRIPVIALEGYEADDVLATVARQCDALGARCYLVTSDKDCRQLITDCVALYNLRKDEVYDAVRLERDWGVRPDQVVDFQSLVGDPTDNVPGVPLIGPKLAAQLLGDFETLDGVLAHADQVKGEKRRQNLIDGAAVARMSRRLVRLDDRVPVEVDFHAARVEPIDAGPASELFVEFGFRSLAQRVVGFEPPRHETPREIDYDVVDTRQKLADLADQLALQPRISLHLETTHLWPRWSEIVGYAFSWPDGRARYVPVRAPAGEPCIDPLVAADLLRPVLEDAGVEKVGQNLKHDMIVLRDVGIELSGAVFDTMVASYLLDPGERNHGLEDLARRLLSHEPTPLPERIEKGTRRTTVDRLPVARVAVWAADRAEIPLGLEPLLAARLAESHLDGLYHTVEIPLIEVLAQMEYHGVGIDVDRLGELSRRYGEQMATIEEAIYELAGRRLNIASRKQLAELLFTDLKLPVIKRTKTGPSTDAAVLSELAALHPLPARVVEYRQYAKLKSTYVDALPAMVHPETGRIHASFHQDVTATGRLSSSDPNLQNIPVRSEAGREIRSAFRPTREGWRILAADYSQIELRVLAHFSGDERLCLALDRGDDVHARVAGELFGVSPDEVTGEMRRRAKAVNFGVIYGQSPFGLAKSLGIGRDEAGRFIDDYFSRYPGVEQFLRTSLEACREKGYVETLLGRKRAIRGVRANAGQGLNLAERTAVNTIIQGSAADLIKLAMVAIHGTLGRIASPAVLLLQIHDELVFEVPETHVEALADLVRAAMCGAADLAVPLSVDMKSGWNWADCEAWPS